MNMVRMAILGVALIAAGLTAYLVSSLLSSSEEDASKVAEPTIQILVAARDLEIGTRIAAADLRWQVWPESAASPAFFNLESNPGAIEELTKGVVRSVIFANSPITPGKIVKTGEGAGFMSAILEGGMRAFALKLAPETGAGGFILPGDRVDVLHAKPAERGTKNANEGKAELDSKTIVENVRVLAIDQAVTDPKAAAGASSLIGKVVTVEVSPQQAEVLANAGLDGMISITLRSLERKEDTGFAEREAKAAAERAAAQSKNEGLNMIRFGLSSKYRPL